MRRSEGGLAERVSENVVESLEPEYVEDSRVLESENVLENLEPEYVEESRTFRSGERL